MSTIYLTATSGKLHKKGETLVLNTDDGASRTIFPFKTEQLVLIGNIDLSTPALKFLMHRQIDTVFINRNGRYNGRLDFSGGKNIFIRIKQFLRLQDEGFRLQFGKRIVGAKLHNQLNFVQRIDRKRGAEEQRRIRQQLRDLLEKVPQAESVASLRGLEGSGARSYFSQFSRALLPEWAVFKKRSMNPPQDNVNAVLSFVYTLILYRVDAALQTAGLDPYAGYFHSIGYGKRSLSFDLMEEYRTPLADTLTVSLFNLGVLNAGDFREVIFSPQTDEFPLEQDEESESYSEKSGILLTREGLRKVITQFERKLDSEIFFTPLQKRVTYKQLFHEQAAHFRRVLQGDEEAYQPLLHK